MKGALFQLLFITPFIGLYFLFEHYGVPTIVLGWLYGWIVIGLIVHAIFGKVSQQSAIYAGLCIVWKSIIWPHTAYKSFIFRKGEHSGS